MAEWTIFLMSLCAMAALMLSMQQHQRNWLGAALSASASRRLRFAGFFLLVPTLLMAIAADGFGSGLTAWFGWETLAGVLIVGANALKIRDKGGRRK